jgi:tRNA-splicing ligase RtcB (3'-phosphate/5'-hydroxy nucleic acid ligase)
MKIDGSTLISWGHKPGPWFPKALDLANKMSQTDASTQDIQKAVAELAPPEPKYVELRTNSLPIKIFLDPENEDEDKNLKAVVGHMDNIVRIPSVVDAAIMPDSMPQGSTPGTIPVGGVVVTKGTIHPGMHSADICCSMAITVFKRDEDVSRVLDEAMKVTHFGYGKKSRSEVRQYKSLKEILSKFEGNRFLNSSQMEAAAEVHFTTQGDGNHFLYVGHLESTGQLALVTHHGSRSMGGLLYKYGLAAAQKHTKIVAPRVPDHQAWLDFDSENGQEYWKALQILREWTKANHYAIHDGIAKRLGNKVEDRFWNEHNFVFMKDDLFYHAKGATPSYSGFSPDDDGRTLIPMNMAEPILIANHSNNSESAFFAPHGAGRNFSRTEHERRIAAEFGELGAYLETKTLSNKVRKAVFERETKGLDVRFYSGTADISELPSSYKSAKQVESQISKYGLAKVVDRILPGGTIMAGEVEKFWKKK